MCDVPRASFDSLAIRSCQPNEMPLPVAVRVQTRPTRRAIDRVHQRHVRPRDRTSTRRMPFRAARKSMRVHRAIAHRAELNRRQSRLARSRSLSRSATLRHELSHVLVQLLVVAGDIDRALACLQPSRSRRRHHSRHIRRASHSRHGASQRPPVQDARIRRGVDVATEHVVDVPTANTLANIAASVTARPACQRPVVVQVRQSTGSIETRQRRSRHHHHRTGTTEANCCCPFVIRFVFPTCCGSKRSIDERSVGVPANVCS